MAFSPCVWRPQDELESDRNIARRWKELRALRMIDWIKAIDELDLSLFAAIPSQTSERDRRSLLAVQRAVGKKRGEYTYLEIGSHLGGSIQPYLCDDRCTMIYSIDPRPSQQPDDRAAGCIFYYENNSTERMLRMLNLIGCGTISKIHCFESEASGIDPEKITESPLIAFIDGEHTRSAAIADFHFCLSVLSKDGIILFHDFSIVYPAILEVVRQLKKSRQRFSYLKLGGDVFGVFFDQDILRSDPHLHSLYRRNHLLLPVFILRAWLKKSSPGWLVAIVQDFFRRRFRTGTNNQDKSCARSGH